MNLRRRSLTLIQMALLAALAACVSTSRASENALTIGPEALTSDSTIRTHCVDAEEVIAGRRLCVLKDLPRARPAQP